MLAGEAQAVEQEAIIDSMSDGLWVCDGEANVLRVNPASARLNSVEPAQVLGRNMKALVEEGLFDRSVTLEVIRTGKPVHMLQARGGRKLVVTGTPVRDEGGRLVRVVVNERDVTEIESLQRELEEQEALRDRFRDEMLEMQTEELESMRVIARSPAMQRALRQAVKVAGADSTVLILGESGVGKGLFADLIHKHSARAAQAARQGELRRHPRLAGRGRALRLREGRLHRRPGQGEGRLLRAGRGRHALPRRDCRAAALLAGEAAALPRGPPHHPGRRHRQPRAGRPHPGGHPPRPAGDGRPGALPARPLLPARRHPPLHPAAPRAGRVHPAGAPPLRGSLRRPPRHRRAASPAPPPTRSSPTAGPGTSASS